MKRKKKRKSDQLKFTFVESKIQDLSTPMEKHAAKIIMFDPKQELFKRILNRK